MTEAKSNYKLKLDELITAKKAWQKACENFEEENVLKTCEGTAERERIHIHRGIEKLAEAVGAELLKEDRKSDDFSYWLYFVYKNFRIFQLFNEEE